MDLGNLGPVELLIVKFPGNHFTGEIAPALAKVVDDGTIRVIDILFAVKNENDEVAIMEINDLEDEDYFIFDPMVQEAGGMLNQDDAREIAAGLETNSSAAIMLFEHAWAIELRDAIFNARGEVLALERIPRSVIQEMGAAGAEAGA